MESMDVSSLIPRGGRRLDRVHFLITFLLVFMSLVYRNDTRVLYVFEIGYFSLIAIIYLGKRAKVSLYLLWSMLLVSMFLFSALYAVDHAVAAKQAINLLRVLLIGNSIVLFIGGDRKRLEFVLGSVLVSSVYIVLLLVVRTPGAAWGSERLGDSIGMNPNALGLLMAISTIVAFFFGTKRREARYFILALAFMGISVATGSRKSFLLIVAGLSIWYLSSMEKRWRLLLAIPVLIPGFYALWSLVMTHWGLYDLLARRLGLMMNAIRGSGPVDASTLTRLQMLQVGIQLFLERPLLGHGAHSYSILTPHAYAHNNYIELLVSVGVLGTTIYYTMYLVITLGLLRKGRNEEFAGLFLALVIGLAVVEGGLVTYYVSMYQIIIACAYAATTLNKRLEAIGQAELR